MAVEDSVAQDQLRAFIERIERMENEKAEIAGDIKEIYAEAKGNGFDTKILRKIVMIRKQDANERMEQEAILDLYMAALGMVASPHADYEPSESSVDVSGIDPDLLVTLIQGSKTAAGRQIIADAISAVKAGPIKAAALRADPAMSIVSAGNLKNSPSQPAPQAGSDLTTPPANDGQVAPNSDIVIPISNEKPETSDFSSADPQRSVAPIHKEGGSEVSGDAPHANQSAIDADLEEQEKAIEPAVIKASAARPSKYAERGVIIWESSPPEGVIRHDYSAAFGEYGQDIAVIEEDLTNAAAQPIVKNGCVILDGWARYMKARSLGIEYPVVQYDGSDSLLDVIRWNTEGRLMTSEQKFRVAQKLSREEPKRKADIYAAFELGMELA